MRKFSVSRFAAITAIMLVATLGSGLGETAAAKSSAQWVTAWGSSQQSLSSDTLSNATVRMIARSTIAGDRVRVKLENFFGEDAVTFGEAWVGLRNVGASLVPGSNRQLTFDGSTSVTIPPGGGVISDPVELTVEAQQDLAVSLYVPDAQVRYSRHNGARTTSYLTPDGSGNHTAEEENVIDIAFFQPPVFTETITQMLWLTAVDVYSKSSTGAIVAFGDSITDGSCTTTDGHDRWEDFVALRLREAANDKKPDGHKSMVNEGIGGNTVTREGLTPPPSSPPGIERLDRDVLDLAGVTHVVLFMGTNDIRRGATADQVIEGMREIITRVKAAGPEILGVTIIPRNPTNAFGSTPEEIGFDEFKNAQRLAVNDWIRHDADFDAVIDFDEVTQDPLNPDLINPAFDCDGIHPNPLGYYTMGQSVDLRIFDDREPKRNRGRGRSGARGKH